MLRNYLKIALRHLQGNRIYAFINIFGLAVGITCTILIALYLQHELSYDTYHSQADQIYRLYTDLDIPNGEVDHYASCVGGAGAQITQDYPEVKAAVRLLAKNDLFVEKGAQRFYDRFVFADASMFDVFSYQSIHGKLDSTTLQEPYTLVLTRSAAEKYFGRTNIVGEVLKVRDSLNFKINAVIEDVPSNSHFHFDVLASMQTFKAWNQNIDNWWAFGVYVYLLLEDGVDVSAFENKIERYSRKYIPEQEDRSGYAHHLGLQKITDIHLHSDRRGEWEANNDIAYVYIFAIIAIFILAIACTNYMNLATARSAQRAKEVGVRKIVGSTRQQLRLQFLGESFLVCLFAVLVALGLTELFLPSFNQLLGKNLVIPYQSQPLFYAGLVALVLILGLVSGSYPAFILSRFQPVRTLKGNFQSSRAGIQLRRGLVIFQFVITVVLIIATMVVQIQMNFMREKNLGFRKEQILVIPTLNDPIVTQKIAVVKEKLLQNPHISQVTLSSGVPGREQANGVIFKESAGKEGEVVDNGQVWNDVRYVAVDFDFAQLYGLEVLKGRNFSKKIKYDEGGAFLINESAISKLGFNSAEEAIGKKIGFKTDYKREIVGVVKDFHFKSLQTRIEPLILYSGGMWNNQRYLSFQFNLDQISTVREYLESTWESTIKNRPLNYFFLDADFDKQYRGEAKVSALFQIFSVITVVIACLGLLGLSAYVAEQKTKEIGIRKVLGASMAQILYSLTGQFIKLVLLASLIAFPIAYLAIHNWLQDFAYRIDIPWLTFPIAALLALAITMATVSFHAFRAASVNPARILKEE